MFENIDTSLIDWSRAQFALTAMYHWLFVPLTLGLAVIMGLMETFYVTTGTSGCACFRKCDWQAGKRHCG